MYSLSVCTHFLAGNAGGCFPTCLHCNSEEMQYDTNRNVCGRMLRSAAWQGLGPVHTSSPIHGSRWVGVYIRGQHSKFKTSGKE